MNSPSKRTILVIDDEPEILWILKEYLESEGYRVLIAEDGIKAIDILKKEVPPNLILLDMKMPLMNGWEFAAEYKKLFDSLSPILIITAAGDAAQRAKDINAVGWIEKPFDLDLLLKKIKLCERTSTLPRPLASPRPENQFRME